MLSLERRWRDLPLVQQFLLKSISKAGGLSYKTNQYCIWLTLFLWAYHSIHVSLCLSSFLSFSPSLSFTHKHRDTHMQCITVFLFLFLFLLCLYSDISLHLTALLSRFTPQTTLCTSSSSITAELSLQTMWDIITVCCLFMLSGIIVHGYCCKWFISLQLRVTARWPPLREGNKT